MRPKIKEHDNKKRKTASSLSSSCYTGRLRSRVSLILLIGFILLIYSETRIELRQELSHDEGVEEMTGEAEKREGAEESVKKLNEKDDRKYFVIHLGPQKTASTSIQAGISDVESTYLREDNYRYIGKRAKVEKSKLHLSLSDERCRKRVRDAVVENKKDSDDSKQQNTTMPDCWDDFLSAFRDYRDRNVLESSEALHLTGRGTNFEWWNAIQDAVVADGGFHVVVVVVYRRLFEWLVSAHNHYNRWRKGGPWLDQVGARSIHPFFPTVLSSQYVDRVNGRHSWFHWTASYLEAVPDNIEIRVLDLHDKVGGHSVETKFFCNAMPNTPRTCQHFLDMERDGTSVEHQSNPSRPLFYDYLSVNAAEAGLVDTKKIERSVLNSAIERHQTETLRRNSSDFPLSCPSRHELEALLNASLYWEEQIVPGVHDPQDHEIDFWKAAARKKFCFIDVNETIRMDEWKEFFQHYV